MNFDKKSPFENVPTRLSAFFVPLLCVGLESTMLLTLFSIFTETIGFMRDTYLSELPLIGGLFCRISPDANASHLLSILLAIFSVGTPILIWSYIFEKNILESPREFFSHPQNRITASFAALILLLVIGLEITNIYTLIAREALPGGFAIENQDAGFMTFLAQNKGLAIAVSAVITVINIVLALFTTRVFIHLKSHKEV